jgi:hypothetical protein
MATTAHTPGGTHLAHLLTPAEVAERLGVTENALAIWRYYRRGPSFKKFGRSIRYEETAIDEFEAANTQVCRPEVRNLRSRR